MSPKDPEELGHWKNEAAEHEFRRLVDELVGEAWTERPTTSGIDTRFGTVAVHSAPGAGSPVILLPGWGAPAVMHIPDLLAGVGDRPYHLVETPGDVGPSVQTAPIRDAADEAAWLAEVLDGLGLDRAHLVGTSLGGYRAMNLAVRAPIGCDRSPGSSRPSASPPGASSDTDWWSSWRRCRRCRSGAGRPFGCTCRASRTGG